jgi:hypothetical protein
MALSHGSTRLGVIGNMSLVALSPLDDLDTTKMGRSSPRCLSHMDNYSEEIVPETCIRFGATLCHDVDYNQI